MSILLGKNILLTYLQGTTLLYTLGLHNPVGEFWQLVSRFCSCLMPRQHGRTSKLKENRRLLLFFCVTLYNAFGEAKIDLGDSDMSYEEYPSQYFGDTVGEKEEVPGLTCSAS